MTRWFEYVEGLWAASLVVALLSSCGATYAVLKQHPEYLGGTQISLRLEHYTSPWWRCTEDFNHAQK